MSARLIVNADDYARTPEVSRGIRQAHVRGIVTSTTAMMNMPGAARDLQLALAECPRLGLGVHLVLTSGRPLTGRARVPSLVDGDGNFRPLEPFLARLDSVRLDEVEAEWRAQVGRFLAAAGRPPDHLDSHHHSSYFTEDLFRLMLQLAREFGCAVRLASAQGEGADMIGLPPQLASEIAEFAPRLTAEYRPRAPDAFYPTFYDDQATRQGLDRILGDLAEGASELMCHPGYVDAALLAGSTYNRQREAELEILTDPNLRQAIQARGIELVAFRDL